MRRRSGPRAARRGRVLARRLADPREQGRASGVRDRVCGERLVEVVLGGGAEAVAAAAHVDEARVASEDLALGLLARSVLPEHRFLEPERQPQLFHLAQQLVGGGGAQHGRHEPRQRQAADEQGIVVTARRQVPQEIDPHELLSDRRPALRQSQPKSRAVPPLRESACRRLLDHPRQRAVVDPRVLVEVLVLGRQDGVAHDERHLVVRHHAPVLACELDHDLSPGVRDLTRRGRLEQDERSELGKLAAVEVDVVHEGGRRPKHQARDDRARNAHGPLRPGGTQATSHRLTPEAHAAGRGHARARDPPDETTDLEAQHDATTPRARDPPRCRVRLATYWNGIHGLTHKTPENATRCGSARLFNRVQFGSW